MPTTFKITKALVIVKDVTSSPWKGLWFGGGDADIIISHPDNYLGSHRMCHAKFLHSQSTHSDLDIQEAQYRHILAEPESTAYLHPYSNVPSIMELAYHPITVGFSE